MWFDWVKLKAENEFLRVTWDDDGLLTSVFDKENDREVLAPGERGNVFQLHEDLPRDFDAWNVDLDYFDRRVDLTGLASMRTQLAAACSSVAAKPKGPWPASPGPAIPLPNVTAPPSAVPSP